MTNEDIGKIRLVSMGLAGDGSTDAASVASSLGVMQAQDYQGFLWALGVRMAEGTKETAEAALAAKKVVRTWLFRGTLHAVAAEDLRWMLALVAPRLVSGSKHRRENLGLEDSVFPLTGKIFAAALSGGKTLSREALLAALEDAGYSTSNGHGYHLIWRGALDGVICQAAPNGTEQDFALLDDWVSSGLRFERESAYAELALRYFSGHGPATMQDFIGWAGITARNAKAGLAAVATALEKVVVEGKEYWMKPIASTKAERQAEGVFLLSGFDEFMLGYKDRDATLEAAFAERICPGNNGVFLPTVVSKGRVVGTWKRTLKKEDVIITAKAFTDFSTSEREGIASAAERYARFLGLGLRLEGL